MLRLRLRGPGAGACARGRARALVLVDLVHAAGRRGLRVLQLASRAQLRLEAAAVRVQAVDVQAHELLGRLGGGALVLGQLRAGGLQRGALRDERVARRQRGGAQVDAAVARQARHARARARQQLLLHAAPAQHGRLPAHVDAVQQVERAPHLVRQLRDVVERVLQEGRHGGGARRPGGKE